MRLHAARDHSGFRWAARLLLYALTGAGACQPEAPPPPNVVVIVLDTLRPDHLGAYGYGLPTSPNLDAWAAGAAVFENAQSAAPWTAPSLVSLFTSLYPSVHNVTEYGAPGQLNERVTTLAEVLQAHGYATAAFTEGGYASAHLGLDQGIAHYADAEAQTAPDANPLEAKRGRLKRNLDATLRWIDEREGERPFFLFLQTYETHTPYCAPQEHVQRFAPEWNEAAEHAELARVLERWRATKEIDASGLELVISHREHCAPGNDIDADGLDGRMREHAIAALDPQRLARWRAWYDAEIHYADAELARLFERLAAADLRDNTLVVVTSDHGEEFGEHGRFGHGGALHDETLRVVLALRGPGVAPRRVGELVRTVDVMPTLLDLLGLDQSAPPLQGRSLVPLLRGRSLRAEPAFSHALAQRGNEDRLWSVRDGTWRLVWDAQSQIARLYDLASDPGETRDVANEHASVCERLLALLNAQREQDALFEQRVSGPAQTGAAPDARALEALGYTSTGEPGAGAPRSKL